MRKVRQLLIVTLLFNLVNYYLFELQMGFYPVAVVLR
jgi:hypothetical protein